MVVPCNEMVAVTLVEEDGKFNDGHTVMIPCKPNSEMTVDLLIPKGGDFQNQVDSVSNVNTALGFLNIFVTNPGWNLGFGIATKILGLVTYGLDSSAMEEKEALYNLKV